MLDVIQRIEKKIDQIDAKLDVIAKHNAATDVTLSAQHESLKNHMHRTELLEQVVAPAIKHDTMAMGILKAVGFVAMLGGIVEVLFTVLDHIRKVL